MDVRIEDITPTLFQLPGLSGSPTVWWFVGVIFLVFAVYSIVLAYHWLRYSPGSVVMLFSMAIYFGGSILLLSTIVVAASSITPSPTGFPLIEWFQSVNDTARTTL